MSSNPKVSIVLPNLNGRKFLEERMESLLQQTLTDWEMIIVDSYSDDGAWEFLSNVARSDRRIQAFQAPRGLYQSWNKALAMVAGEYVYIATNDDSMMPNALELMASLLDEHNDCKLCDSNLIVTDEDGQEIDRGDIISPMQMVLGDMREVLHIRRHPHDALVYTLGVAAYKSITQILFRKTLLDQIGLFETRWGAGCDFEWGFRAALSGDVVYTPEKLCTWRRYDSQATSKVGIGSYRRSFEMLEHGFQFMHNKLPNSDLQSRKEDLIDFMKRRSFRDRVREGTIHARLKAVLNYLRTYPVDAVTLPLERVIPSLRRSRLECRIDLLDREFALRELVQAI